MQKLQWTEPPAFRRAIDQREAANRPWQPHLRAAGVFVAFLALRGFVQLTRPQANSISWPLSIGLAVVLAVFAAYLLPWVIARLPNSTVIISEKGINRNTIGTSAKIRFWSWQRIGRGVIATESVAGNTYRVLRISGVDGNEIGVFGLREQPTTDAVRNAFAENAKPIELQTG
jgi:hypothetical protein